MEGLEEILTSIETVYDIISGQSYRQYAIEVMGEVPAFIEICHAALKDLEKIALTILLNRAIKALATPPSMPLL